MEVIPGGGTVVACSPGVTIGGNGVRPCGAAKELAGAVAAREVPPAGFGVGEFVNAPCQKESLDASAAAVWTGCDVPLECAENVGAADRLVVEEDGSVADEFQGEMTAGEVVVPGTTEGDNEPAS